MDRATAIVLTGLAGCLIGLQPALNAGLGRSIGAMPAAVLSLAVGTVFLVLVGVAGGLSASSFRDAVHLPWHYVLGGGLVGAAYVGISLRTVSTLGAQGLIALTVLGQFFTALALDHFGMLGLPQEPITVARLIGIALVACGAYLLLS